METKRLLAVTTMMLSICLVLVGCSGPQTTESTSSPPPTTVVKGKTSPPPTDTATLKVATVTLTPTFTGTFSPSPSSKFTSTAIPTGTPSLLQASTPSPDSTRLMPGIYAAGGCTEYTVVQRTPYGNLAAGFNWCVVSVEISKDGSMIFLISWQLVDFSEQITEVTKRGDLNNPNMFVTDNLKNRYDALTVSGEGAKDIRMEKGVSYISTFTFRPPKPGAYIFTFHDDDNDAEISNIILDKPAIYIYDIEMKWTPTTITYFSDKWTASETDQGGFWLTHMKYPNCQVMEWEPGEPKGTYVNTIDIGSLKYDIYKTAEADYSLREYALVGNLDGTELTQQPLFHVTVPYDDSLPCLDDVSSILASLKPATP